ncbi:MAG: hypothetical protein B6245_08865 [Desulfobacteraceae bacterium 4572_88]|nr:MAG: hypothetical protein B6245_08865 [Desulfobacteraceae bacterium 4572_88]
MLYSLKSIKKVYKERTVLDLPELHLERSRIYVLMGPNGSGKTRLLNILSFLDSPSEGTVFYQNQPVFFSEKHLQPLRREVVLVNQHPILFSTSVYKNVEFGMKVRKIPGWERPKIVEECLDLVGMRDFIRAQARHLSGGETQRVAIARALACSPKVMLFDEPTSNVDVSSRIAIENIICDLHEIRGIPIILSTHDLLQASKLTYEKIFLFQGRIAPSAVYENIFTGFVVLRHHRKYCQIAENVFIPVKRSAQGRIKISVNPESLKIFRSETAENKPEILKGRVSQLTEEQNQVRVIADVGIPLSVMLKQKEYAHLGIRIGDHVMLKCSYKDVEIILP